MKQKKVVLTCSLIAVVSLFLIMGIADAQVINTDKEKSHHDTEERINGSEPNDRDTGGIAARGLLDIIFGFDPVHSVNFPHNINVNGLPDFIEQFIVRVPGNPDTGCAGATNGMGSAPCSGPDTGSIPDSQHRGCDDCINDRGPQDQDVTPEPTGIPELHEPDQTRQHGCDDCINDREPQDVTPEPTEIPEFPTVALPIISVIILMLVFQRKKGK